MVFIGIFQHSWFSWLFLGVRMHIQQHYTYARIYGRLKMHKEVALAKTRLEWAHFKRIVSLLPNCDACRRSKARAEHAKAIPEIVIIRCFYDHNGQTVWCGKHMSSSTIQRPCTWCESSNATDNIYCIQSIPVCGACEAIGMHLSLEMAYCCRACVMHTVWRFIR